MDLRSAIEYEAKQAAMLMKSEDVVEGMNAFLEKKKTRIQGEMTGPSASILEDGKTQQRRW